MNAAFQWAFVCWAMGLFATCCAGINQAIQCARFDAFTDSDVAVRGYVALGATFGAAVLQVVAVIVFYRSLGAPWN